MRLASVTTMTEVAVARELASSPAISSYPYLHLGGKIQNCCQKENLTVQWVQGDEPNLYNVESTIPDAYWYPGEPNGLYSQNANKLFLSATPNGLNDGTSDDIYSGYICQRRPSSAYQRRENCEILRTHPIFLPMGHPLLESI